MVKVYLLKHSYYTLAAKSVYSSKLAMKFVCRCKLNFQFSEVAKFLSNFQIRKCNRQLHNLHDCRFYLCGASYAGNKLW